MASDTGRSIIDDLLGPGPAARLAEDGRPAILWSHDPARPLWMSEAARRLFPGDPARLPELPAATPALSRILSFARTADPGEARREALRFLAGSRFVTQDAEIRRVRLTSGADAVLTLFGVATGAAFADAPAVQADQAAAAAVKTVAPSPAAVAPDAPAAPVAAPAPLPAVATLSSEPAVPASAAGISDNPAAAPAPAPPTRPAVAAPVEAIVARSEPATAHQRPTRPVRFVFQTDPDGTITALSPGFAQATGHAAQAFLGQKLDDVLQDFAPDAAARISDAFARRTTWNSIIVTWPLAAGDALVPTELAAAPVLGPDRTVSGYSGFGICRMDRLRERPAQTAPTQPAQAAKPEVHAPADGPAPVERVDERLDSEIIAAEADDADIVAALPGPDLSPAPLPPEPPAAPAPRPVQDNARLPDFGDQRVVALPHVRGQVGASMAGGNVVPMKPAAEMPAAPAGPGLSMAERSAFREIAKALGARFEGAEATPEPKPAREPAPVAAPAAPAIAAPVAAPVAGAPDSFGRDVLERLPIGVLVFRGDEPLFLNRPLLDLTGYADIGDFKDSGGLARLFPARPGPGLATGEFDTVTIVGRDGRALPVDAHLQTIDWHGAPATLVSFRRALDAEQGPRARNLETELKARRADLAEARAMLDTATDGVISLDDTGRILALNRSAEALFGYDQKELAGEQLTLLLAPESHALALDYLDGLKANGVASVLNDGREIIGKERNGGRIPLFMTIGRVSETNKFAAVVRDLTAWKRAEAELTEAKRAAERASALKSDFLAKISHEIRTPMNAIIGFAEVMRDERLGPIGTERYKEYLKDIHTSGEHVISLVNDLLDLSKIEAGRMDLTFGSVDLNAVVSSCIGIMQPQANRDRVIMRSQLAPKLPPVVADERSIRQIVLNLLSNASKFTEPGGQVIISTALTETGEAVIRVRDTGIGMTESEVQAALEPFRQLSATRHRGGTGLGLPLTKALVEANRAAFTIRSKSREGTLVEITFPPTRVLAE